MSSLRKPKRICIYGTDEREHHFLVKGGEDLRLDERIQQLFRVMNDVVKKNGLCSSQNIQVGTYKVSACLKKKK
jgi:DNA-dependent protein kinase catalytic subunit